MTSLASIALMAHGDTPTRGRYAPQLEKSTEYLLKCTTKNGLITSPSQESGMPMHAHGFALLYLASVYGMDADKRITDPDRHAGCGCAA